MKWNQDKPVVLMTEEKYWKLLKIGRRKTDIVQAVLKQKNGLTDILEHIYRTESDWRSIRAYLHLFDEYDNLLTKEESGIVLDCLCFLCWRTETERSPHGCGKCGRVLLRKRGRIPGKISFTG